MRVVGPSRSVPEAGDTAWAEALGDWGRGLISELWMNRSVPGRETPRGAQALGDWGSIGWLVNCG